MRHQIIVPLIQNENKEYKNMKGSKVSFKVVEIFESINGEGYESQ